MPRHGDMPWRQWLWWDAAWETWVEPRYFKSPYTTPLRIFPGLMHRFYR